MIAEPVDLLGGTRLRCYDQTDRGLVLLLQIAIHGSIRAQSASFPPAGVYSELVETRYREGVLPRCTAD